MEKTRVTERCIQRIAFVRREIAQKGKCRSVYMEGELVAKQRAAEPGAINCNYTLHRPVLFQLRAQSVPRLTT